MSAVFKYIKFMKHKKLLLSVAFLLLGLGLVQAQETVSATGGEATGAGGSSSYTVGQILYSTNSGTNGSVAQGVQQPYEISTTTGIEITEINLQFEAYPNPTVNYLTLNIGNYNNENLAYQLYDMQGKLIGSQQIANVNTTIEMEQLPTNTYLLNILENNSLIKTFRIIKN